MGKLVVGVGNVLLGDEGVGWHVAHALEELSLPDVKVIDGGTCPDALQLVEGADKLVIVDAVKGGGMPGQVYRFHLEDITPERKPFACPHDISLVGSLMFMRLSHNIDETVIIGVEPGEISWGLELSPELQEKMPKIIDTILLELNSTNPKGEMKC